MVAESRTLKLVVIFLFLTGSVVIMLHMNPDSRRSEERSCMTQSSGTGVCVPDTACAMDPFLTPPMAQCGTTNDTYVCCARGRVTEGEASTQTAIFPETTTMESPVILQPRIHPSVEKTDADVQSGMSILQATECGKGEADEAQNDTNFSEYPWMAYLVFEKTGYKSGNSVHCSGSLITDRYVLTVAHCVCQIDAILVSVRLGEYAMNQTKGPLVQEINVEEAIYHKDYDQGNLRDDIALVRLVSKAIFNTHIHPVCLPITTQSQSNTLDRAIVAAWSTTEVLINKRTSVLKKGVVQVMDNDYCQQVFRIIRITEKHICAIGSRNVDGRGISGGPLFISMRFRRDTRYVQFGVLTAGYGLNSPSSRNIYAKVVSYLPWIAANLKP